ncbi:hypothetical protein ACRRTK_024402 [Alexandromys fortis]
MKSLLLTFVLFGLVSVLKAQEVPSDDQEDFSGTWYTKAMVSDKDRPEGKGPKKVFPIRVIALEGGDLELMITYLKKNQCHEKKIVMHKTDEPGKYSICEFTVAQGLCRGEFLRGGFLLCSAPRMVIHSCSMCQTLEVTVKGKNTFYIQELPVKDHYIFYCEHHQHHGKSHHKGKLVGRNPEENPEAMEEFKKFVQSKGLKEENILVPEQRDQCVPESD